MKCHNVVREVCRLAEDVLKELEPKGVPHAEFFELDNLWRIEIWGTCQPVIEHYLSILSLTEQGLARPAAALMRGVHEAQIRFEFLADNEHELRSWVEWRMSQEYHRCREHLQFDSGVHPDFDWDAENLMVDMESILGGPPKKTSFPWKSASAMLENIAGHLPDGFHKRMRRRLIEYPSEYVHNGFSSEPVAESVIAMTEFSVLLTVQRAMRLCCDKSLVSPGATETANGVVALCDEWIESESNT